MAVTPTFFPASQQSVTASRICAANCWNLPDSFHGGALRESVFTVRSKVTWICAESPLGRLEHRNRNKTGEKFVQQFKIRTRRLIGAVDHLTYLVLDQ